MYSIKLECFSFFWPHRYLLSNVSAFRIKVHNRQKKTFEILKCWRFDDIIQKLWTPAAHISKVSYEYQVSVNMWLVCRIFSNSVLSFNYKISGSTTWIKSIFTTRFIKSWDTKVSCFPWFTCSCTCSTFSVYYDN